MHPGPNSRMGEPVSRRWRHLVTATVGLLAVCGALFAGVASAQVPVIGSYFADRGVQPTHFSPLNIEEITANGLLNNYVREITWSSWGRSEAIGAGKVSLVEGNQATYDMQPAATSPVAIHLTGLRQCLGLPTYTAYSLSLAPGAAQPFGWPKGQSGKFPCQSPTHTTYTRHPLVNCWLGLKAPHYHEPGFADLITVPWHPRLPWPGLTGICSAQSVHDENRAIERGIGIRENITSNHPIERNWPATYVLSKPIWCPTAAWEFGTTNAYSRLRVKIYGPPRKPTKRTLSSWSHRGLKVTGVGGQEFSPTAGCVAGIAQVNPIPAK